MLIGMVPAVTSLEVQAAAPGTLYLKPNSNWLSDGARFAAYFYGNGDTWASMTDSDGDGYYECAVPSGYTSVIFCRMNGGNSTNSWDNKWNQTSDLSIPTGGSNCYTVADGSWDGGNGTWSTYAPAVDPASLDYYLFGFINGADHATDSSMGNYKFTSNKLSVTFSQDSYVAVKASDNTMYMAQSYTTATSATLYKTSTGAVEKMYVPGGIQVNFTLTVNTNGTVKLSYTTSSSSCQHLSHNTSGVCSSCGGTVNHSWSSGKCTVCGKSCSHSYSSKVTTAATCTKAGVKTYTCTICQYAYTESIAKTGHSYSGGKCTVCGATDSSYAYYLFGYINGANYACEEDTANLGSYKFSSGKLTVTFTQDSYVAVKASDNANWFMAQSYTTATSVTLYNTSTGANEKMFVPGGVKVTFTLTVNSNGTLKLSYTTSGTTTTCQHTAHNTSGNCTSCGVAVGHTYSSAVTKAATCTAEGVLTYTCSGCSSSYTESIPVTSHNYTSNVCTVCGAAKAGNNVKIHFYDTNAWRNVCVYMWKTKGSTITELNSWPGDVVSADDGGYFTIDLDYTPVSGESLGFIFHNFNGAQTADVVIDYSTMAGGEVWIRCQNYTDSNGKYPCYVSKYESSLTTSPEVDSTSVTFRYKESATSVYVAGSFNNWSTTATPMTKNSSGVWTATVNLGEGVHEYKYIVNGNWVLDPRNPLIGGYDGNSLVVVGSGANTSATDITVKIHFYRENGDYKDWDAWIWCNTNGGQALPLVDDPIYKGKTATVTINGAANNYLMYKIRKTDWSDEEFWERSIDLTNIKSGTVHFFLNSGHQDGSIVYGNDVVKMAKPTYANIDYNSGDIWVKTPVPVSGDPKTAFSIVDPYGNASGITIKSVTLNNNGYSLSLSKKPTLAELANLRVKCNTMVNISTDGLFYSSGFAADYTYYGDDLGANWSKSSTTFKVWAPTATGVSVNLYKVGNWGTEDWIATHTMKAAEKGTWYVTVSGDLNGVYYNYQVHFPNYSCEATDPYAKAVGVNGDKGMVIDMNSADPEGWDQDVSPNKGMNYTDAIIYEMHIREMTIDASSGVKEEWRGKYLGLTQTGTNYEGRGTALQHLKELGVTHVQIMPMYDNACIDEYHLEDWEQYGWGYDPKNFNVPEGSYSTDPYNGAVRITEAKQMIQTLHANGINVVMDVVYNHTFSGGDFCYNKIVPNYFSRFWGENNWSNGSGCGNDLATERSMCRNFIVDSILYWADEYHIDGFRFDLAGLIDTQTVNEIISTVQAKHPYVIFYGEGWTGGGSTAVQDGYSLASKENAYQVGSMAFYNDTFRNEIAGDDGKSWGFATGAGGKGDAIAKYFRASNGWSNSPSQTINYVSCHDNYTLIDKIIISRNGAYWEQMVRMNNLSAAIYMLSQGIPFVYSGEELLREKVDEYGNRQHNCYNSNDYTTKIRWSHLVTKDYAQVTDDYYSGLIQFRKNHAALRNPGGADAWNYTNYYKINDKCILFYISGYPNYECSDGIVIIFNANENGQGLNIYDYGVPYGNWQACIHGMQAGVNPLWSTSDGNLIVDGISATVLVNGDLIHEESVYNKQSYKCSCGYHNQSGLCWDCGSKVSHTFKNGYCTHCNLAESASGKTTIYFDNSGSNWSNVYAYAWTSQGGRTYSYTGDWPGTKMTSIGNGIYSVTLDCAASHVIFSDNAGNQTVDQGLIKNNNGVITYNMYRSSEGNWDNYSSSSSCSHSYTLKSSTDATCSKDGSKTYTCSKCGTSYTETIASTGHVYTISVTSTATCTTDGVSTYSCRNCTYSYTETTAAKGHNYVNSVCTTCGAVDLSNTTSKAYYLFGYIDGADYGEGDDYQNLGSYKFNSSNTVQASFLKDSYVGVKVVNTTTGEVLGWYMTKGYVGEVSSATLYNSSLLGGNGDKLYAPAGQRLKFTLKINSDGTLSLSYSKVSCSHSYTNKVTTAATCTTDGVRTYTCSKCSHYYVSAIAATGHTYTSGICSTCGAADPNYESSEGGYILVTNISQITAGGDFVIVVEYNGNYYAMDSAITSGKINGIAVNLSGDKVLGADLPMWTIGSVSGGVSLTGNGVALSYSSSNVWIPAATTGGFTLASGGNSARGLIYNGNTGYFGIYSNSYASRTGYTGTLRFYKYHNGTASCNHTYTSKVTTAATCSANGVRTYTCSKCSVTYTEVIISTGHSYVAKVTKAATCTATGVKTFTCSGCSGSYTETIPATGHIYTDGKCITCGSSTSGSTEDTYYLFGYINGTNYACEESADTLGAYKFVNGKLTVTFTADSYVGVKTSDNQTWYLTDGWQGQTSKSVTLYESSKLTNADKFYVPGNVEVHFTITKNSNGTIKLSYTLGSCSHVYSGGVCTNCGASDPTGNATTYYLFGYINGEDYGGEWDAGNVGNYKFVNGKLTATFTTGSYVAVKTADNSKWFMTDGWVGTKQTSVTLYDTKTLSNADKFYVPGGVQLTFTLVENSDGSINLSYTSSGSSSSGTSTKPTFTLKYPTVSFEDMIVLNVYYAASNIQHVEEMGLITFNSKVSNYDVNSADRVIPGYAWSESDGYYVSSSAGIAAKNLGDTIYFAVYARLKDGTYAYSSLVSYSPKTYAYNQLKSGSAEMKALVVAMLNYGAMAQTYFGYKTGELVNADLTAAQKALVSNYSSSMMNTVSLPDNSKMGSMVSNGGYSSRYPTISFEGVFSINYYFTPSKTPSGNIVMYVWNQEDYEAALSLSKANATKAINMSKTGSNEYLGIVDGIAAKDLDKGVYVAFCYTSGSTEYCSGVVGYSIGTYCTSQASKTGTLANLAASCAVYGYYAKQLFGG